MFHFGDDSKRCHRTKQNSRWKNVKGTPMVTTLSLCLYNKIINQEKKETKERDEGKNIERSYKDCGKRRLFCVHKHDRFITYIETFNQPGYTATAVMFSNKIKETHGIRDTPQ